MGSFEDIVPNASQSNPQGQSVTYVAHSITFRDQNGNIIVDNPAFSLVYFMGIDLGGGYVSYAAVGGLDGSGGSASGYFNVDDENYWGFVAGQTANYPFADNGRWEAFVDLNGNGNYGTYDPETGLLIAESGERIGDVCVSNFQAFQTGAGTLSAGDISGWYVVPTLKPLGLSTEALSDGTNVVRFQIAVTNLASFRLECRDSLTNAAWASLGTFAATGAVTEVSDTNTVPSRFYRVVRP
ncbi:MAG: hypothetical protein KBI41_07110 [Kiritimatiellae bacterium]|nr:hypothetical protein [Kiritimatiellia bacterium]MDD2346977.1 hypothetical protein [Kiritimatiellia bacterium]MDD3583887.1 hypothetical protein [Kiritimatiellia bacterium]